MSSLNLSSMEKAFQSMQAAFSEYGQNLSDDFKKIIQHQYVIIQSSNKEQKE